MKNRKKIAIVTGGAGFIGSHMVDLLLKKNHEVRVIDDLSGGQKKNIKHHVKNKNLKFLKKNINNINSKHYFFKNVDHVYHFAGKGDIVPSIEDPNSYFVTNIIGTSKILEACYKNKIKRFVYAASSSCYGIAKSPTDEKHPINPLYPYALSKYMGEKIMFHWGNLYNLEVNSIRIFNTYGKRVKTTGVYGAVFGVFFRQALSKKALTIVGDGNQKRDFLHVKDAAEAFYALNNSKYKNQIYNLGAGNPIKIKTLAKLICDKQIKIPKRPGEPEVTFANIKKIKRDLNWSPKIRFEEGVKDMLKDIKSWKEAPLWNKNSIKKATMLWFKYMSKIKNV